MRDSTNFGRHSPVEKARLCLPGVTLTDAKAADLAAELDWVDTWRDVASTKIQRDLLENIAKKTCDLAGLISQAEGDTLTCLTYEGGDELPPFKTITDTLDRLAAAAISASTHRGGGAVLRGLFGRAPDYTYIGRLAGIYERYSGQSPGIGYDWQTYAISGPFVSFVQEVTRHFCTYKELPPENTIKMALRAWKKNRRA